MPRGARRPLALLLLLSLAVYGAGLGWGLPNGEVNWAADSFKPLTALALAKRAWLEEPWNSGWFYFKYPLGHAFVLLGVQAPYLAWLKATGSFERPTSTYPYGFRHPEVALRTLAILGALVSALMAVGLVALTYASARMLFGPAAGGGAALLVLGSYPVAFYAHTANVDVPMLFWLALALAAVLVCADRGSLRAAGVAGVAAAMALYTKEQSIGILVALPLVWMLRRPSPPVADVRRMAAIVATALGAFVAVTVVVGNVWWNPMGFVNRWRFLLGTLPAEVRARYAPYSFFVNTSGVGSLERELSQIANAATTLLNGLTVPVAILCSAGLVWALRRQPRRVAIPLVLLVTYHVLVMRSLEVLSVRYVIPAMFVLLLCGGYALAVLYERLSSLPAGARRPAMALVATVGLLVLLPAGEVDWLLLNDPRYAVERWLRSHGPAGAHVEVYQQPTYLPRFPSTMAVRLVPLEQRSPELLEGRRPELIVLSSAGQAGITRQLNRDWEPGESITMESLEASEFLTRLRAGVLGYRMVAHAQARTLWITPRINSLNPEITVFARDEIARSLPVLVATDPPAWR